MWSTQQWFWLCLCCRLLWCWHHCILHKVRWTCGDIQSFTVYYMVNYKHKYTWWALNSYSVIYMYYCPVTIHHMSTVRQCHRGCCHTKGLGWVSLLTQKYMHDLGRSTPNMDDSSLLMMLFLFSSTNRVSSFKHVFVQVTLEAIHWQKQTAKWSNTFTRLYWQEQTTKWRRLK